MVEEYQDNYGGGWISVYRSIKCHWVWADPVKLKWWLTILFEVNHSAGKLAIGYDVHEIKSGQSAKSLRTWAKEFDTGTKSVVKFFDMLEKDGMIKRETIGKGKRSTTLLTVLNYGVYQNQKKKTGNTTGYATETQRGTQRKHNGYTNNNDNNEEQEEIKETEFDIFWKEYDYNTGLRQTQQEWSAITKEMPSEIAKILINVPKYVMSKPDKKYRKKPENYLKDRVWLDGDLPATEPKEEKFVFKKHPDLL